MLAIWKLSLLFAPFCVHLIARFHIFNYCIGIFKNSINIQQQLQQVANRPGELSELGDRRQNTERRVQIDFRSLHANFNQN